MKRDNYWVLILLVVVIALNFAQYFHNMYGGGIEVSIDTAMVVSEHDVLDIEPVKAGDMVIGKINIPVPQIADKLQANKPYRPADLSHIKNEETTGEMISEMKDDSMTLDVVQRKYTDDTSYVAYISGVRIGDYPRLDSIRVRHRVIERNITKMMQQEKGGMKIKVRPAVGVGYGMIHHNVDVYVGGSIIIDW